MFEIIFYYKLYIFRNINIEFIWVHRLMVGMFFWGFSIRFSYHVFSYNVIIIITYIYHRNKINNFIRKQDTVNI